MAAMMSFLGLDRISLCRYGVRPTKARGSGRATPVPPASPGLLPPPAGADPTRGTASTVTVPGPPTPYARRAG